MRTSPDQSTTREISAGTADLLRSRSLLRALVLAASLSAASCGGGGNGGTETGGTGGVAGSAGEAGTGGTDTGGTGGIGGSAGEGGTGGTDAGGAGSAGGTDGGDLCANKEFNGLASRVYQPGDSDPEDDPLTVSLNDQNPDKAYNGLSLRVTDGALFLTGTRVGLEKVLYTNYQTGYGQIGNVSGVRPVFMDAAQPYKDDGTGNCVLNLVDVDSAVLADTGKRPVMKTPEGYFTTVFKVEDNSEALADYTLEEDRTGFGLSSVNAKGMEASYIMGNSKPSVPDTVSAHRDTDGHIVLTLDGTTDEGFGGDNVLAKLNATASGLTFEPVPGEPGKFRSTAPSSLTNLDLEVEGLNRSLTEDKTVKSLTVTETDPCLGIDTNGHGTCESGVVTCDPGFANNDANPAEDCDGCDTANGIYENNFPTCSPDETPPNAPVITTHAGGGFSQTQENFKLAGTTDSDTDEMWVRIVQTSTPGAGTMIQDWTKINSYPASNPDWTYNATIPSVWTAYDFCFRAEDKANNQSSEDCINVSRTP